MGGGHAHDDLERVFARRALIHHRQHEEQLERMLVRFITGADGCKCANCRELKALAKELETEIRRG